MSRLNRDHRLPFLVTMLILSTAFAAANTLAGDNNDKTAPSASSKTVEIGIVAYYSSNITDLEVVQRRLDRATEGIKAAREQLNVSSDCGGLYNVADDNLAHLAKYLKGGQKDAERFRPLLEDGWLILIITDPKGGQKWYSQPSILNPHMDAFDQIRFARDQHRKLNPHRYLVVAEPTPTVATPPVKPPPSALAQQPPAPPPANK